MSNWGQCLEKMILFIVKLFGVFLKLLDQVMGEIHGEFKRIDSTAKIVASIQNAFQFLAMKNHAEFMEETIRISYPIPAKILCLFPTHATRPKIKRFTYQGTVESTRFGATPNAVDSIV